MSTSDTPNALTPSSPKQYDVDLVKIVEVSASTINRTLAMLEKVTDRLDSLEKKLADSSSAIVTASSSSADSGNNNENNKNFQKIY